MTLLTQQFYLLEQGKNYSRNVIRDIMELLQWCIVTLIGLAGMSQVLLLLNATDMLTSMIIGSGRKFLERPWPLPLKAGVQGSTESGGMFLRPTQQFRSYSLNER
ncbi:hypothetical protein Peur_003565 [Populus x canadensis]